jgi:hypothetical protein
MSAERLVKWEWPGSDREKRIEEFPNSIYNIQSYADVLYAYMDSEGQEWGKTRYSGKWICLDDPENNSGIPAFNPAPTPIKWSSNYRYDWSVAAAVWPPSEPDRLPAAANLAYYHYYRTILIIVIISVIFVATVTLIVVFRVKSPRL